VLLRRKSQVWNGRRSLNDYIHFSSIYIVTAVNEKVTIDLSYRDVKLKFNVLL